MELVGNRSFILTTSNGKCYYPSRMAFHRDPYWQPFPHHPHLRPANHLSRKYTYTDDLAIMHADGDWQAVVMLQSKDMATVSEYRQTWKLKLSTTKSVLVVFHLNNKEARRELKVNHNNETLPFWSEPIYLARMFERTLTYRRHLESFRKKLASCVALLRQLDGPGWVLEQQRCKQPT